MELVLPEGRSASAALAPLRDAYARRLLKRLAAGNRGASSLAHVVSAAKREPELVHALVLDPTVAVTLECGDAAHALALLLLSLAERGALEGARVSLPTSKPLWCVRANVLFSSFRTVEVTDRAAFVDGERITLAADTPTHARVTRPFDVIAGEIRLARFDPNPLALAETHPDKNGNAVSLGDATLAEWLTGLRDAFAIVERHLPGIAAEMHAMLGLVVPVGTDPVRHLSASYREYVGALYLTLHPDPMTMAEALLHEFQHNKLNLVSWHYKVLENGYDALYRSPVRPDARPLMGILLAAHAFVPVAELYVQALEGGAVVDGRHARARLEDVVSRNDEALRVLSAHAVPDAAGARVLARLASIHARHLALGHALARDVSHVA